MSNLSIREQVEKYGFCELYEPDMVELLQLEKYRLLNTEERNRDNGKLDLSEDLNFAMNVGAQYIKNTYVEPYWKNAQFLKYTVWDGVDRDNQGWHTDMFEEYDIFFLFYNDDTAEETGGAIQFKYKEDGVFVEKSFQPKAGSLFCVSNARGFWHRAESTSIQRRVVSFDFIT